GRIRESLSERRSVCTYPVPIQESCCLHSDGRVIIRKLTDKECMVVAGVFNDLLGVRSCSVWLSIAVCVDPTGAENSCEVRSPVAGYRLIRFGYGPIGEGFGETFCNGDKVHIVNRHGELPFARPFNASSDRVRRFNSFFTKLLSVGVKNNFVSPCPGGARYFYSYLDLLRGRDELAGTVSVVDFDLCKESEADHHISFNEIPCCQ